MLPRAHGLGSASVAAAVGEDQVEVPLGQHALHEAEDRRGDRRALAEVKQGDVVGADAVGGLRRGGRAACRWPARSRAAPSPPRTAATACSELHGWLLMIRHAVA